MWITALSALVLLFSFLPVFLSHQFPLAWPQNLSAEARTALLEISDVETEVGFVQNVPREDSKCNKGGHTWERKENVIASSLDK